MILDKKKFYACDKREYILQENEQFLLWLNKNIDLGYIPPLNLKELQKMIDVITTWYEYKYPVSRNSFYDIEVPPFTIDYMSDAMTLTALRTRLTTKERVFLDCKFRIGIQDTQDDSVKFIIKERSKNVEHQISIDCKTGLLKDADLEFLELFQDVKDSISIVEMYHTLKMYDNYDISELKSIHLHHKTDLRLRRRLFELINLALIYSKDATPEIGYKRAQMFSREFSRYFHIDIEPPELESLPLEKPQKRLTDTVKMMRLISKISTKISDHRF